MSLAYLVINLVVWEAAGEELVENYAEGVDIALECVGTVVHHAYHCATTHGHGVIQMAGVAKPKQARRKAEKMREKKSIFGRYQYVNDYETS